MSKIKGLGLFLTLLLTGYLLTFPLTTNAQTENINTVNNVIIEDGFENISSLDENDKFYSEFGIITTKSDEVISGEQSLKLQTTDPAGTYTITLLTTERDVVEFSSKNSYRVSMKLRAYSFADLMIEVRYDWNSNSKESMPYEFGLHINENYVSRRPGWISLSDLIIYDEYFHMDDEGIITLGFTFTAEKEAVIELKGKTGDEAFGYLVIDDFKLEKLSRMEERFENIIGNFWDETAFWANAGGLVTDDEAINNTSLKYEFTDNDPQFNVALGGITTSKFEHALGEKHQIDFLIKGLPSAENFVLVLEGGGDYYEFNLNLEDGTYNNPGFVDVVVEDLDGYYHVSLVYIANENENYEIKFFGGGQLGEATGIVLDDFIITVEENKFYVTPILNNTFNKANSKDLLYQVTLENNDFTLKDEAGEVVSDSHYTFNNGLLTIKATSLDALKEGSYSYIIEGNNTEKTFTFNIIDTRPVVTESLDDYQASLKQHVNVKLNLKGFKLTKVLADDANLTSNDYTLNNDTLTIKNNFLETLETGLHTFTVVTSEGSATFDLNIVQGDEPVVENEKEFTKGKDNDVTFTVNIPLDDIKEIKLDDNALEDYTLEDNKLTIKSSYLMTLNKGSYEFTILTDYAQFTFTIEVKVEKPVVVGDQEKTFTKDETEDVTFNIDTKGLDIISITNDDTLLTTEDYTFDENVLTINSTYLNEFTDDINLVVKTEAGEVTLTINIETVENTKDGFNILYILIPVGILLVGTGTFFVIKRKGL